MTESRLALAAVEHTVDWVLLLPVITDISRQTSKVEDVGGQVALTWFANGNNYEGYQFAEGAAQRAAQANAVCVIINRETSSQGEVEANGKD